MKTPELDEVLVEGAAAVAWGAVAEALATYADTAIQPWASLPDEVRVRVREYVGGCIAGNAPPDLHARWCDTQAAAGWKWGTAFDYAGRVDPDLVVFSELPIATQTQFRLMHSVALAYVDVLVPPPTA